MPPLGMREGRGPANERTERYEIAYATYLGGDRWDQAREVIPYPDGTVLVGGMTSSSNMPTTSGVVQPKYAGDDPSLGHGGVFGGDAFLVRLSRNGRKILTATYFGGSKQESKKNISGHSYANHKLQVVDINEDGRMDIIGEGCGYKIISYCENRSDRKRRQAR